MRLRSDAKKILTKAWSIRFIAIAALLSGAEVLISLLDADLLGLPRGAFAALAGLVSALAIPARLIAQSSFAKDESGAVGKRAAGGAAFAAAVVALSLPMIQIWEGRSLVAYADIAGIPTICDGETRGVKMGDVATPIQCDAMTAKAVREFEQAIRPCLPENLPVKTRAAFVVNAYNIGAAAFCKSSMSKKALAHDLPGACQALLSWNKAKVNGVLQPVRGLTNRRMAERALCLEGLR